MARMIVSIGTLYDDVLGFLLRLNYQNPSLYFISYDLISDDKQNTLLLNEAYTTFSFWNSAFFNKAGIYEGFYIGIKFFHRTKEFSLVLTNGGNIEMNVLIESLLEVLGKNDFIYSSKNNSNNQEVLVYEKKYGKWAVNLNNFIAKEKVNIDNVLTTMLNQNYPISFLSIDNFRLFKNKLYWYSYIPNENTHLSYLRLANIGHFENISLDLSKQVTVLIGENGSGKSTILRAIALGITGTDFFDLDKDLQRTKNEIFNGFLKINDYKKGVPNYSQEGSIILFVNDKDLTLKLSPSKLIATKVEIEELKENRETILHESTYLKTLVLGFSQSEAKTVGKDFEIKGTKPNVLDLFPLISNAGKDGMNDLVEWIYYYVHDRENTEPVDKLFAIFSKIVSDNSNNETVTLKRPYKTEGVIGSPSGKKDIIVCTPDMPDGINLSLVSQGYKNIFRWVSGILMGVYNYQQNFFLEKTLAEISGIVLIDEIDTYLHPKWQVNILRVLTEEFPKLQFIVTTHSELVLSNLHKESIYMIDKNAVYQPYIDTLGMDSTSVLRITASPYRMPAIQDLINEIKNLIEENNLELAMQKIAELKKINSEILEIIELEALINVKHSYINATHS
jgi:predicted ATP-binding protein involved in virulence